MRTSTLLRLATTGGRSDTLRIVMTALGSALGALALLCALTIAWIGPDDGPYRSHLLSEPGLHQGVIVTFALLGIPLLVFVGQCSRIGAPGRDRRLAALRMAGATPADVTRIAAVESALAAAAGALAGLGVYLLARQLLDSVSGPPPQRVLALPTDVLAPWWALLAVVAGLPAAAALFSSLALRRVTISPFGVLRETPAITPRALPAVLLIAGAGGMAACVALIEPLNPQGSFYPLSAPIFLGLFALAAGGLILGTASVAAAIGRLLGPRVRRPWLLIASRRMMALPLSASRTSSAVLLAVLIGAIVEGARVHVLTWTTLPDVGEASHEFYSSTFDLIDIAIAVALVIGAAGLLVNAAEGIVTRRRSYASLAASGTPRGVLARAALTETLLPLIPGVILAAATGILAARGLFGTTVTGSANPLTTHGPGTLSRTLAIPVPWAQLGVLIGGSLLITALTTAVALLFLRAASDPSELCAAA